MMRPGAKDVHAPFTFDQSHHLTPSPIQHVSSEMFLQIVRIETRVVL
jgi:hypothetical protein